MVWNSLVKKIITSIFIYIFAANRLFAGIDDLNFRHFSVSDGLSSSRISCIMEDDKGFMWIGTYDGLDHFDGYKFTTYRTNLHDTASISGNAVFDLMKENNGNLWVASIGGLDLFNDASNSFIHYRHPNPEEPVINKISKTPSGELLVSNVRSVLHVNKVDTTLEYYKPYGIDINSLDFGEINDILVDPSSRIWIASSTKGVFIIDPSILKITRLHSERQGVYSLLNNNVWTLMLDNQDRIWVGTEAGINIIIPSLGHEGKIDSNLVILSDYSVQSILEDRDGTIWVGTSENGVFLRKSETSGFKNIRKSSFDESSIKSGAVLCLENDRQGNLWLGTLKGIDILSKSTRGFKQYHTIKGKPGSLSDNRVNCFYAESSHKIWIGTDGGGLNLFDRTRNRFTVYERNPNNPYSLNSNTVMSLFMDSLGYLWVGTCRGGINIFDESQQKFYHYTHDPGDPTSLCNRDVRCIFQDHNNNIWIATNGGGLDLLDDREKMIFKHFQRQSKSRYDLATNSVLTILEDHNHILWIGTYYGLTRFDPQTGKFLTFRYEENDPKSLSHNWVYALYEDSSNRLWAGTSDGLNLVNRDDYTFKRTGSKNGFLSNVINAILEDDHGNLWISTNDGIAKFNPETEAVRNFTRQDGLSSDEFIHGASLKLPSGEMLFGSTNGFTLFHPDSIRAITKMPPLYITGLKFFEKYIYANSPNSPLRTSISQTRQIELSHEQATMFSLEFSAQEYLMPEKIKYRYKLEGYSDQWIQAGSERKATFTNLSAGHYIFYVNSTNPDGTWNPEYTSLSIKINPPFWKSRWAMLLYFLLVVSGFYIYHRYSVKMLKLKTDLQVQKIEKNKALELQKLKADFFTNISHEFRTPLTLIVTPLMEMIRKHDRLKDELTVIKKNAERLSRLVNQIIDFNKIESDRLELNKKEFELVDFTKKIIQSFSLMSAEKNIRLHFESNVESCYVVMDPEKYDMIIYNLLSNAFKFTPENGEIRIECKLLDKRKVEISVKDNGKGIAPEHLEHIFDRFYHIDQHSNDANTGAGIGLTLCREMVEQHNGTINVESKPEEGSCFQVVLPVGTIRIHSDETGSVTFSDHTSNNSNGDKNHELSILIVEDDKELCDYLRFELLKTYSVLKADNGKQGLEIAERELPDLIISDVMMCEMDGLEMTRKIRDSDLTCHIPVILLTAKTADFQKREGLETGADRYITKPFDLAALKLEIRNVLKSRQILRERYSREIRLEPSDVTITSRDEQLLKRAIQIVEEHMQDQGFDVDQFSRKVGFSRSQLLRKLKMLTLLSPAEFIKDVRLKKAAMLLEKTDMTVTQICYETGFNYPAHFTQLFQQKYSLSPTKYRQKHSVLNLNQDF